MYTNIESLCLQLIFPMLHTSCFKSRN